MSLQNDATLATTVIAVQNKETPLQGTDRLRDAYLEDPEREESEEIVTCVVETVVLAHLDYTVQ